MSYRAMVWAARTKAYSGPAKSVLCAIAFYADDNGVTFVSQAALVRFTDFSDRAVRNCIAKLVELGLLVREARYLDDGGRTTDRLALCLPARIELDPSIPPWPDDETVQSNGAPVVERSTGPRLVYGVTASRWESLRKQVFARDRMTCVYCGGPAVPPHCDHIIAFSKGGPTALENLATACGDCNVGKRNGTGERWMAILLARAAERSITAALPTPNFRSEHRP